MSPAMGRGAAAAAAVEVNPIILEDQKSSGTGGGTFTSGAWQTRTLNTEVADPEGLASIASNIFTLQPGKYLIMWSAPAAAVNQNQSRLYDVTGSAVEEYGSSSYVAAGSGVTVRSEGAAYVDIGSANAYRVEHRCTTTFATNGFGVPCNYGNVEVYTIVTIVRLGDASS